MATNAVSMRNNFSETWLSLRFELLKHLKRRRLAHSSGPGDHLASAPLDTHAGYGRGVCRQFPQFHQVLIVISAAMFAGDAVCGEFEKKTSLLLFPTPQNRASIFAGKYLAALLCTLLVVALWYVVLTLEIRAALWLGRDAGRSVEILHNGLDLLHGCGGRGVPGQQRSSSAPYLPPFWSSWY